MSKLRKNLQLAVIIAVTIGFLDASYLTYEHFFQPLAACGVGFFADCGTVLQSKYSVMFGIPLAIWGMLQYAAIAYFAWLSFASESTFYKRLLFFQTALGFIFSLYFVYIQVGIIGALCQYCLLSAITSTFLYIIVRMRFQKEHRSFVLAKIEFLYKLLAKPFFFILPAEFVHDQAMFWGPIFGNIPVIRAVFAHFFKYENKKLHVKVGKVSFSNPIGLAAGYDYNGVFTEILPEVGYGFQTIGTISNKPCEGNESPRLGRLPKSQSLLVNKGFRNPGADAIIEKLDGRKFNFPVGISVGRTNNEETSTLETAIDDIIYGFKKFKKSKLKNSYYELNISCPNLKGNLSLYPPENLKKLLKAVDNLGISKPLFVKMPIEKTDKEVRDMLKVISSFKYVTGVIFGNLQKDRKDRSFHPDEIVRAGKGNFSGKPTFRRSNELIKLAYREYGTRLVIIGCGGVFTPEDAYRKIRCGATLVQMITGMIYEGPQRISQINHALVDMMKEDGFENISEAVGVDA